MGSQFQLAVYHVLQHLQHAIFYLFRIVGLFNILFQFLETFILYFFFSSKEEFAFLVGTGYILIHINAYQDAYLIDIIQERAQREIA